MKSKLESRLPGEISITSHTQRLLHILPYPYGRKWRRTEEPLNESERGERKSWLKIQHSKNEDHGTQSHHFMGNSETRDTVTDFIFLGSKITVDGDCSHEIKIHLFLGRKAMTNLDSILKSRDRNANQNYKYHLTPVRMAIITKSTNNTCWRGCRKKGVFLHSWWECKLRQTLWEDGREIS